MKNYPISRSNKLPDALKIGRQCVVIYDSDTPESIRAKITPEIYYLIDMRIRNTMPITDILNGKARETTEEKKHRIF